MSPTPPILRCLAVHTEPQRPVSFLLSAFSVILIDSDVLSRDDITASRLLLEYFGNRGLTTFGLDVSEPCDPHLL